ncbi:MAG: F0F1 ATP synthase subunit delta [Candidatus Levybacteria bacterium]|nr:F0F1 ATP synthase subunit delta [Candidatus Levybacteria bacterium]
MEVIDLSDLFNTRSQAEDFSARLELVAKEIFETGFNPEKALLSQFGITKKETFMNLLRNNNVNAESRLAIKEFIDKIQAKIASLPVMSMVLAFEPTDETLQAFSRWFILNTKKQVLFDIKIDKTIIGGAAILSNGKYLDYSIKPTFEKVMTNTLLGHRTPRKVNSVSNLAK